MIAQNYSTERLRGIVLSAVRIVVAFLLLCHGLATIFGVLGGAVGGRGAAEVVGAWPGWWAGLIQLVTGALVLIGLFTRPAAVLASGTMAFAYFFVHQPVGALPIQNRGELAALYSWIFLLIAVLGPGPYAVDTLLQRTRLALPTPRAPARVGYRLRHPTRARAERSR